MTAALSNAHWSQYCLSMSLLGLPLCSDELLPSLVMGTEASSPHLPSLWISKWENCWKKPPKITNNLVPHPLFRALQQGAVRLPQNCSSEVTNANKHLFCSVNGENGAPLYIATYAYGRCHLYWCRCSGFPLQPWKWREIRCHAAGSQTLVLC